MNRAHPDREPGLKDSPEAQNDENTATGANVAKPIQEEQSKKTEKVLEKWEPVGHQPF